MPALRAIIFDLDDTLYPEREYVYSGFQAVAAWANAHLGIPQDEALKELWHLFCEGKRGNIFDQWLSSRAIKPEPWIPQMVKAYREHQPRIKPYPEALDLLSRLRKSYKLGLLTDGHGFVQKIKLEALGLASYFDAVVFSDDLGKQSWKPSTTPFKVILEQLGTAGFESVYIADNPLKDFLGARLVGMWTIRIRHSEGLYSQLIPPSSEYAPHEEISSLNEIPEVLANIEEGVLKWQEGVGHV